MLGKFNAKNEVDIDGNPAGGTVTGVGLSISWQNGPLGRGEDRKEPNGAFVETGIAVCKQRILFYEKASGGKFACKENGIAIALLQAALDILNERTKDREARQVEGEHKA